MILAYMLLTILHVLVISKGVTGRIVDGMGVLPTNITLGFVSVFCTMQNLTFNGSLVTQYDPIPTSNWISNMAGTAFFMDIGVQLAIENVNRDSNILPGAYINYKRFSNCDVNQAEKAEMGLTGGFGASRTPFDVYQNTDVVGLVGFEYSTTVRLSGEVFGQFKIPYCSASAASPRLSDKQKYPYFFRMVAGLGIERPFYLLFKEWKVNRIAIIYQSNDEAACQTFKIINDKLESEGLSIPVKGSMRSELDAGQLSHLHRSLREADARYIVILGQIDFLGGVLWELGERGYTGPEYVFLSYADPQPPQMNYEKYPNFSKYAQGFIVVAPATPDSTGQAYMDLNRQVFDKTHAIAKKFGMMPPDDDFISWYSVNGGYDCAMLMLRGFHKVMEESPNFTYEQLSNRKLNDRLNYSAFLNLDLNGITSNPIQLTSNGDLEIAYDFHQLTGDYLNYTIFGRSDANGTRFSYTKNKMIFNGGSSAIPGDGVMHSQVDIPVIYSLKTQAGQIIIACGSLGLLLCILATLFLIKNRRNSVLKAASVPDSLLIVFGCFLMFLSVLSFFGPITKIKCFARKGGLSLGTCVILSTLICRNAVLVTVFWMKGKVKGVNAWATRYRSANVALICLNAIYILAWIILSDESPQLVPLAHASFWTCRAAKNPLAEKLTHHMFTLNLVLILALVPLLYFIQKVHWTSHNESSSISVVGIAFFIAFGLMTAISKENQVYGGDLLFKIFFFRLTDESFVIP
ncbi:periplasmic binding protein-like I [Obelidium mucronatum]|nr:periplasmic binding protein-like I [Obelidium mucronatum]